MGPLPITGITNSPAIQQMTPANNTSATDSSSFGKFLSDAIDNANDLSNQADATAATYAAGGPVTVDQVMVAEQKASLALDLVVQVRDRVVNAYQTIMNMQV